MIQVLEGDVIKGAQVGVIARTSCGLLATCILLCGHKQQVRYSDLAAELTIQCIQCQKTIDLKATGNGETPAQFKSWTEFRKIKIKTVQEEETNATT